MERCVVCGVREVDWPRVCEFCTDHEAQAELAIRWGFTMDEQGEFATGKECRTCGMIYDGDMRCRYCGDANPLDDEEG